MINSISFDDVLCIPADYSEIVSRKDPDTTVKLSDHLTLKIPIVSSCMNSVTEAKMAIAMHKAGGLGILHRYNTIEEQLTMVKEVHDSGANCGVAVGATKDYLERTAELIDNGVSIICCDVANGHSVVALNAISAIRKKYSDITIIAGNVASAVGAVNLAYAGADSIRCGIGGGSACSTRVQTAFGVPTLQTIINCYEEFSKRKLKCTLIADGGIKNSGDCVKSLVGGADCVILGQLLASTDESPGEIEIHNGVKYKKYFGMASFLAQSQWQPEKIDNIVPEGEDTILRYKGSVEKVIRVLVGGIRSGMSYGNAKNISDLRKNVQFTTISSAGMQESIPHAKYKKE